MRGLTPVARGRPVRPPIFRPNPPLRRRRGGRRTPDWRYFKET